MRNCAYYPLFEKPKIVFPNLQNSNKFAFDDQGIYLNAPAVFLPTNDLALLAILNSKVVWYFLLGECVIRNGGYIEVKPQYFERIPIPEIDASTRLELAMVVDNILTQKRANPAADTSALEAEIDLRVFRLYGLTHTEVLLIDPAFTLSEAEYAAIG